MLHRQAKERAAAHSVTQPATDAAAAERPHLPEFPGHLTAGLPTWDHTELRILDAAAELIPLHGIEALTLTAIAKRAGVSRPTVYRRWPGSDEIVRTTLLRTTITLLETIGRLSSSRSELVSSVQAFARLFLADPLYSSLLRDHPAIFTRYSTQRLGASQLLILGWIEESIRAAQERRTVPDTVRDGNASDMAIMVLLIAQSAILSHLAVASRIGEREFETELGHAIDGYLRP